MVQDKFWQWLNAYGWETIKPQSIYQSYTVEKSQHSASSLLHTELSHLTGPNSVQQDRYGSTLVDFDLQTCFDLQALGWYREAYESIEGNRNYSDKDDFRFLYELGLLRNTPEGLRATVAAILLFGRDGALRDLLPRPVLDAQAFKGTLAEYENNFQTGERLVSDRNLIWTWQSLRSWYQKIIKDNLAAFLNGEQSVECHAFFEAAVNILIHQDYSDHSRKAEIRLFNEQIIFSNPGHATASLTDLLSLNNKPVRNPHLINALRRIGFCYYEGSGLRRIFKNWQKLGYAPPSLTNDKADNTFRLVLHKELHHVQEQ